MLIEIVDRDRLVQKTRSSYLATTTLTIRNLCAAAAGFYVLFETSGVRGWMSSSL